MLDPRSNQELPPIPAKRYFTIGEVSDLCAVKPHVLRYWEQEFPQLKPVKRRATAAITSATTCSWSARSAACCTSRASPSRVPASAWRAIRRRTTSPAASSLCGRYASNLRRFFTSCDVSESSLQSEGLNTRPAGNLLFFFRVFSVFRVSISLARKLIAFSCRLQVK